DSSDRTGLGFKSEVKSNKEVKSDLIPCKEVGESRTKEGKKVPQAKYMEKIKEIGQPNAS
ncbi:hypothetical protein KI387_026434, partial [Taxus chinensis]